MALDSGQTTFDPDPGIAITQSWYLECHALLTLLAPLGLGLDERVHYTQPDDVRRGRSAELAGRLVMASAHDVAAYILRERGEMTAMKLQKLVYYAQAWSLVWDEEPLFRERIEAWANGPVVPVLYTEHRGQFKVRSWSKGDPGKLTPAQRESIDAVLGYYGDKPSQWLSDLTHREAPWLEARRGLSPGERGSQVISHASMAEYYGSLI